MKLQRNNGRLFHATPNCTNQLTTCNILLLNKLIVFQIDKKFPALYVTRSSSLLSQQPDICPYSTPDRSVSRTPTESLKINFNIILPSTPMSSKWPLSYWFPHQYHVWTLPLPHNRCMPRPSHSSQFNHKNNIW
jgi:hypothetical protein